MSRSRVKLREKVTQRKRVTVVVREDLWAHRCDGCEKIFDMDVHSYNDTDVARLHGTFDTTANDSTGRGMGNMFFATVCSFRCAGDIFNGGWRKMKEYLLFKEAKAELVRANLLITAYVRSADELVERWEASDD